MLPASEASLTRVVTSIRVVLSWLRVGERPRHTRHTRHTRRIPLSAPIAKRIPHPHSLHGDVRPDDYYWLRERSNPEVIQYLEAENRYLEEVTEPLRPFQERLYQDMLSRIQQSDEEVPAQYGPYFYYSRTVEGQQYRIHGRKRAAARAELPAAKEEVILDLNRLADGKGFLSVTLLKPSPDHSQLAYLQNEDGSDRYTLYVKDLATGALLPERIEQVFLYASLEWDASGQHLFYVTVDDTQRPYQLWRHRLGDSSADALLYQEDDETFSIHLSKSHDGAYLFLNSDNKETAEVRYLDASTPDGVWNVFAKRERGILYDLEHWHQDFLILTNRQAPNFTLMACPVTDTHRDSWREVLPYNASVYLQAVTPFSGGLVLEGREEGQTQIWVLKPAHSTRLGWPEPIYAAHLGNNPDYAPQAVLVRYESLVTPSSVYELDLETLALTLIKRDEVPGHYDPTQYVQERLWARASDGTQIPVSVVYRKGARDQGPAPLILYAYGSYGFSMDPGFVATRIPLLDRGIVYAVAHIRGGSEMGRQWYEDGKFLHKMNTFTDFIAVAEDLVRRGYTTPDRLAIRGGSAGGLLMGAVMNLRPDLFRAVGASVPFVDVVTTMLDASIPLTTLEWDEWGNPADAVYYQYMKSYSPYDNVEAKDYPHVIVFTGLNDPRVSYWEPAKWVARLRATKTDANTLVMKCHMGAGHGGSSGRYDRLKEQALELAFLLDKIGVKA